MASILASELPFLQKTHSEQSPPSSSAPEQPLHKEAHPGLYLSSSLVPEFILDQKTLEIRGQTPRIMENWCRSM